MNRTDNQSRGKIFWFGTFAVLVLLLSLAPFAPSLFAQVPNPQDVPKAKENQRYYSIIQNVFEFVQENYVDEVDAKKLYEGALKGILESLGDPHSVFLDESMMNDLTDTTTGKFGGVGLFIGKQQKDPKKDSGPTFIEIVSPIEDTPGWKAGLMAGDLIIKVNGESMADLSTDDAVSKLRGSPGSKVVVSIRRGEIADFDVTLVRAIIEVPTVKRAMIPGGIAYLRIIEFSPQTVIRIKDAIKFFETEGYSSLIIDVRNNPGGLLNSCVEIADLFLDSGVIVSTKSRNAEENEIDTAKPGVAVPKNIPVIVLINRGSASASEILAGALKDQHRAYLIGEKSYGKGSVQRPFPLGKTGFKLTMSRYYTPSDVNIDKIGIPPDLEVKDREYTEAEITIFGKLIQSGEVSEFVRTHQDAKKPEVDGFIALLKSKGYNLEDQILQKLVRDEISRRSVVSVYDAEFDLVLKAAIRTIKQPDFNSLVAGAKTLKQLQDEAKTTSGSEAKK